ncbi:hypothetical protein [Chitinibacter sp. GC72]|uniref:hypothetical protein n=1 Tax=Chitinibacter sp. GC72 TaxID=1526917 RepID=UPI0012F9F812|nr:hypothetical protein [Chitinibacter sp. GC72]
MAQMPNFPPASLTPGTRDTTFSSRAHSGRSQSRRIGTTLLTFDVAWSSLDRAKGQQLWAFIQAQNGRFGRFEFQPALLCDSANSHAPAMATVRDAANSRQRTLVLSGLPASKTVLNAGDYVRFGNHSKVYALAADAVSDASGAAAVTLTWDLIEPLAAGVSAKLRGITVRCSLQEDTQSLNVRPPFRHDISVKLIEEI